MEHRIACVAGAQGSVTVQRVPTIGTALADFVEATTGPIAPSGAATQ